MILCTRRIATFLIAFAVAMGTAACAQEGSPSSEAEGGGGSAEATYDRTDGWGQLPDGREWGAVSAVYPALDGEHIWVAERCGTNLCEGSDLDPVLLFDLEGNLVRSFGAGLITWPHGITVDSEGNVWVADAVGYAPVPDGVGHTIMKFSPEGELLMELGQEGVAGATENTFTKPSDILVAPNGDLFVVDGHDEGGNNRVMKFSTDGTFLLEWGTTGSEDGEFRDPHALAMDSQGRLFVGDRANSRIQIFDQEGTHLETWTQFGRPSGLFIDENDVLYAADSESNARRNRGWKRGVYIGSARDGWVTDFISDVETNPDESGTSAAEGIAVDRFGNVYGAEVGPRQMVKYTRR